MAESAISAVVSHLGDLLKQEAKLLHEVDKQIEWVQRQLQWMRCFLQDADSRRKRDESVENWVKEVIDVACQAEDIIDTYVLKLEWQQLKRQENRGRFLACIMRYASMPRELLPRHHVGMDIENLEARIREIRASKDTFGITGLGDLKDSTNLPVQRMPLRQVDDSTEVIGLDDDKKAILGQLVNHQIKRRSVVSIVGMGGAGKTTIARKIYQTADVRRSFDICIWLSVSKDAAGPDEILNKILAEVKRTSRREMYKKDGKKQDLEEMVKNSFGKIKSAADLLDEILKKILVIVEEINRKEMDEKDLAAEMVNMFDQRMPQRLFDQKRMPEKDEILNMIQDVYKEIYRKEMDEKNEKMKHLAKEMVKNLFSQRISEGAVNEEEISNKIKVIIEKNIRREMDKKDERMRDLAAEMVEYLFDQRMLAEDAVRDEIRAVTLRDILLVVKEINRREMDEMDEKWQDLAEMVNNSLVGRKYLIFMDDVWTSDVWSLIRRALPDENNGSRVLITTRIEEVAKMADPASTPYKLRSLNNDDSLKLFLKKAFPTQDVEIPKELSAVAQQLVSKCQGLPLALVVVGGLLSIKEKNLAVWQKIADTMNWQEEGKECREIIALSYEDLPPDLKPCFLYLSSFPEDFEIRTSVLLKLWVSEGFIPQKQMKTMEETAENYLNELIGRCMIQISKRKLDGSVKTCRVHDLIIDLAKSEAKEGRFLTICNDEAVEVAKSLSLARRLAIRCHVPALSEKPLACKARTLILEGLGSIHVTASFQFLRVLELRKTRVPQEFLKQINFMIHLRHLGLQSTGLQKLPSSIGNLGNLQSIDVRYNPSLIIPSTSTLWEVKALRHVRVSPSDVLPSSSIPWSLELNNLQTLETVSLPDVKYIRQKKEGITERMPELKIPNLRKLKVHCEHQDLRPLGMILEQVRRLVSLSVWHRGSIMMLEKDLPFHDQHHLRSLRWSGLLKSSGFVFPPNLTKLYLERSYLRQDQMPMLDCLQQLCLLSLGADSFSAVEMIFSSGGFPQLKLLSISNISWLKRVTVHEGALPKLTRLNIQGCRWCSVDGTENIPGLQMEQIKI